MLEVLQLSKFPHPLAERLGDFYRFIVGFDSITEK